MANTVLQLRGGTTTQHGSFAGADREITVDTTLNQLVLHRNDGTASQHPLASVAYVDSVITALKAGVDIDMDTLKEIQDAYDLLVNSDDGSALNSITELKTAIEAIQTNPFVAGGSTIDLGTL